MNWIDWTIVGIADQPGDPSGQPRASEEDAVTTSMRSFMLALLLVFVMSPMGTSASDLRDETISVRGHWVLEVRDPDGTPVARREFDNALADGAAGFIGGILARLSTPGNWRVVLTCDGAGCLRPCSASAGTTVPADCVITENRPAGSAQTPSLFRNLVVSFLANGFQLRGFAIMDHDTTIGLVAARIRACNPGTAAFNCADSTTGSERAVSSATITPVLVTIGQQVLVTLQYSFATVTPPSAASGAATSR